MCSEKVTIQRDKQFIVLEGENSHTTVISWEAGGNVVESSTFTMLADNFVARDIAFKVIYLFKFIDLLKKPYQLVLIIRFTFVYSTNTLLNKKNYNNLVD